MDMLFWGIPLICFLCSLFLFLVVLNSKRTKLTSSFLVMLGCGVLWTGGSVLMRLGAPPGMYFWYYVSATGIFAAPYCIYNFLYYYTNSKSKFTNIVLMLVWAVLIVANLFDCFLYNPSVEVINDIASFHYEITPFAIIPVIFAAITIAGMVKIIYRSIREDGVSKRQFTPLLVGVLVMFFGLIGQAVFQLRWLSTDTIFCGVNAICIYYALYRRRMLALTPIASRAPLYMMAIAFTTCIGGFLLGDLDNLLAPLTSFHPAAKSLSLLLIFSTATLLVYATLRTLTNHLLIKSQELRENRLATLSREISSTLDTEAMVRLYRELLSESEAVGIAYICLLDEGGQAYRVRACTQEPALLTLSLRADNPLVEWLGEHKSAISYQEFFRTKNCRSMWEAEKAEVDLLGADLFVPITSEETLLGLVLIASGSKNGRYSIEDLSFLESAASIMAIGLRNALLYAEMEHEAQLDPLTGLYNRSYFLRSLQQDFERSRHDKISLLLINIDDFRLYNELYGSSEGDKMLCTISDIIVRVVARRGTVARYGGKEIIVSLPFCNAQTAETLALECQNWLSRHLEGVEADMRRYITVSAGICTYPTSASSLDDLLTYVNMAVYTAKRTGKNKVAIYSKALNDSKADATKDRRREFSDNCAPTIYALTAAIDAKDHYTFNHSENVARYASTLASAIGLDSEHVEIVRQAGILHDIGKIGIPESILSKDGRLSDEELTIMKRHVEGSIAMIRHLPSLDYVIPTAIAHHERWDGKGYPRGISGTTIPIGARCLCLADTFDAMTSNRPYRKALSAEEAVAEIERGLGTQFDPELGRTFMQLVIDGQIKSA